MTNQKMTNAQIKEFKELAIEFFNTRYEKGINKIYGFMTGPNSFRLFISQNTNQLTEITKAASRATEIIHVSDQKGIRLRGCGYNKIEHFVDLLNIELEKDHQDKKQQTECARFKYEKL